MRNPRKELWRWRLGIAIFALLVLVAFRAKLVHGLCVLLMKSRISELQRQTIENGPALSSLAGDSPTTDALLIALALEYAGDNKFYWNEQRLLLESKGKVLLALAKHRFTSSGKIEGLQRALLTIGGTNRRTLRGLGLPEAIERAIVTENLEFLEIFLIQPLIFQARVESEEPVDNEASLTLSLLNFAAGLITSKSPKIRSEELRYQLVRRSIESLKTITRRQSDEASKEIIWKLLAHANCASKLEARARALAAITIYFRQPPANFVRDFLLLLKGQQG